jgi:hypothetical protein
MSFTAATYPIVAAVKAVDQVLGSGRKWVGVNDTQQQFLREFFEPTWPEEVPEIEAIASQDASELAKFLARHGFPTDVAPFGPQELGTASVLDLLVEWVEKGDVRPIRAGPPKEREYAGVSIPSPQVAFFRALGHAHPIVCVHTRSEDVVYMTMLDLPPQGLELARMAQQLYSTKELVVGEFYGVLFPMVELKETVQLDWLVGLKTEDSTGGKFWILKGFQKTRFRMNEIGARAEVGVLLMGALAAQKPRPVHVIDRPFLLWFHRPGLARPLFVAHITEEDWRNPQTLD